MTAILDIDKHPLDRRLTSCLEETFSQNSLGCRQVKPKPPALSPQEKLISLYGVLLPSQGVDEKGLDQRIFFCF